MKQRLGQFKAQDYTFADSRECKFVEKLCEVRVHTHAFLSVSATGWWGNSPTYVVAPSLDVP